MTDRASQKPNGLLQFSGLTRTDADETVAEEAGVEPTEDACAPSNGFEARAPHRERYSSEAQNCGVFRGRQPLLCGGFPKSARRVFLFSVQGLFQEPDCRRGNRLVE